MIPLQPGILEVIIRWSIFAGGPLSTDGIDIAYILVPYHRAVTGPIFPNGSYQIVPTLISELSEVYRNVPFLYPFADPATNSLLHTGTHIHTQQASTIPLQSSPGLDKLIADLKAAVTLPGWVGNAIKWAGLITLIIGLIAYFASPSVNNRRRGYKMMTAGFILTIIGFAFPTFIGLITHVLSG